MNETIAMLYEKESCGLSMTNLDLSIDDGLGAALRAGKRGNHFARNFCGDLWFADGKFHEAVHRYHSHVGTYSADTLEELMNEINSIYGSE